MKSLAIAALFGLAFAFTATVPVHADNTYAESVWKKLSESGG